METEASRSQAAPREGCVIRHSQAAPDGDLLEDARELFDEATQEHLGMSGEEFLRRWDAGEFADDPDRPEVIEVAVLIPPVR